MFLGESISCITLHVISIMPNNFISKIVFPEYFIQKYLHVVPDMPVEMHIYACAIAHDTLDGHEVSYIQLR